MMDANQRIYVHSLLASTHTLGTVIPVRREEISPVLMPLAEQSCISREDGRRVALNASLMLSRLHVR
jgi:hypothetical protein